MMRREWRLLAACAEAVRDGVDPETWFPAPGDLQTLTAARAICAVCPVQSECLSDGLAFDHGVWGGVTSLRRREQRVRSRACIGCGVVGAVRGKGARYCPPCAERWSRGNRRESAS